MVIISSIASIGASVLTAVGATTLAASTTAAFVVGLATQVVFGAAMRALAPKPKLPSTEPRGYTVNQRGSALDHQIVYGRARVGGAIVFTSTTGTNNRFLHQIIAYTGHEIEDFDEIYINDARVTGTDGLGNVTEITLPDGSLSARYNGFIRIKEHLGSPDQEADSDLLAEVEDWTTNHRLRGIAYLYVRYTFDADVFPNGVPEVTVTVKGKKVFDPRTETTAWSDNPALCLRDYLTSGYGLGESSANIDDTLVSTAADVCDQTNTIAGTARFTCNGNFTTGQTPDDVIGDLLTSMCGLLWYAQGEWRMKPGYWVDPTIELNEDDLRSNVFVNTRHSRRDNFNTIRGTFRGDETDWQLTDYPEVTNAAFLSADNGQESVADIELPFTDNSIEARRIARIMLERNRQQLTVGASFGLRAFQVQVGDVVQLSLTRFGWSKKEFEVVGWTFGFTDGLDLQVQMTLREISESVFDEIDDGIIYERDNTNLLSPFEVPNVGLSAVARTVVIREKLTNIIALSVSSDRPEAVSQVEAQFKASNSSTWINLGTGELGPFEAVDLEDGNYDFRARAINTFGVRGQYAYLLDVVASGLLDPPADVVGLTAEVNGATIYLEWQPVPDLDLSYYRVRHSVEEFGASWANSTMAVDKVPRPATSASVPTRPGTYHVRAVDKSGVASTNYTSVVVPAQNLQVFANTDIQLESPTFAGTKVGCSVVSDALLITDTSIAPSSATYDFSAYIDTGVARRVRSRVEANVLRIDESAGLFDDVPGLFDELPGLFDSITGEAQFSDVNVEAYISTTPDNPAGDPTWSEYMLFRAGDYYGRAFRFRVVLTSTSVNVTLSITGLRALVEYD